MKITGQVKQVFQAVSKQLPNGTTLTTQGVLLTYADGNYNREVYLELVNDKITKFPLGPGMNIIADINLESREYNGRYYTNARIWNVAHTSQEGVNYATFQQGVPGQQFATQQPAYQHPLGTIQQPAMAPPSANPQTINPGEKLPF